MQKQREASEESSLMGVLWRVRVVPVLAKIPNSHRTEMSLGEEEEEGGWEGVMAGRDERKRRAIVNFRQDRQIKTLSYTALLAPFLLS